ncbi:hypothetical protein AB0M29_44920 [Streptomyces sp. NPDC051976]|uniref:hypothetical protein n=1 Tax=Streptomyces sp. NPDC051976 TaxID=3154947 RepID=UPI003413C3FA
MILYHYSCPEAWPAISASGRLDPRWPKEDEGWPKTVHLTDQPDRLPSGFGQGRTLRFTVDIEARPWGEWGRRNVPSQAWISLGIRNPFVPPGQPALSQWNQDADHWYVTTEPIPSSAWVEVRLVDTGQVLWPTPSG